MLVEKAKGILGYIRQDSPGSDYLQIQRYVGYRSRGITAEASSEVSCTILVLYFKK